MLTLAGIDPARQLAAAEHDLAADFPSVPPEQIHDMMLGENARYASAHVRDFVSILVARTVRTRLLSRNRSLRISRRDEKP